MAECFDVLGIERCALVSEIDHMVDVLGASGGLVGAATEDAGGLALSEAVLTPRTLLEDAQPEPAPALGVIDLVVWANDACRLVGVTETMAIAGEDRTARLCADVTGQRRDGHRGVGVRNTY